MSKKARETGLDLTQRMSNGATVSDWLGTAMTAAECAARYVRDVRHGGYGRDLNLKDLERAERYAQQALDEIKAIRAEVS